MRPYNVFALANAHNQDRKYMVNLPTSQTNFVSEKPEGVAGFVFSEAMAHEINSGIQSRVLEIQSDFSLPNISLFLDLAYFPVSFTPKEDRQYHSRLEYLQNNFEIIHQGFAYLLSALMERGNSSIPLDDITTLMRTMDIVMNYLPHNKRT